MHFHTNGFNLARVASSILLAASSAISSVNLYGAPPVEFNRDIRPILSDNCFACHGPDSQNRAAGLRLDIADGSVGQVIIPGDPEASSLIKRIEATSDDERMPPPESHKQLTADQKTTLRSWIAQGAPYEKHWSFEPPIRVEIPSGRHPIDYLVHSRLAKIGLEASPKADKRTLIRRAFFDLVGVPPTFEEVESFEKDESPNAYEKLIDELTNRPEYGERMAMGWLDVVRFADTIGYHSDTPRNIWPYRDYVVRSFQRNKPFDQFTIEQLAGDLLEDTTQETRVASAFNRLLLTTEEGGAQAKDYEQRMLTDRVRAVGTVWLGLTTGCAQCHDHKFDPITAKDFYSLGAFFADIKEGIIGAREPGMPVLSTEDQTAINALDSQERNLQEKIQSQADSSRSRIEDWASGVQKRVLERTHSMAQGISPTKITSEGGPTEFEIKNAGKIFATVPTPAAEEKSGDGQVTYALRLPPNLSKIDGIALNALAVEGKKIGLATNGNFVLTEVELLSSSGPIKLQSAKATFEQNDFSAQSAVDGIKDKKRNGWAVLGGESKDQTLALKFASPLEPQHQELEVRLVFAYGQKHQLAQFQFEFINNWEEQEQWMTYQADPEFIATLSNPNDWRKDNEFAKLKNAFLRYAPELKALRDELASIRSKRELIHNSAPKCLVSVSNPDKRIVRILPRGDWMDESGEIVSAAVPKFIEGNIPKDRELNRLDLARWIVAPENPLTARTIMNRLWKHFYGTGLSRVLDDLGAQGETPANQELLDWLATEFIASGWNYKHMVHLIVTSETYQQSANLTQEHRMMDPTNRELARQNTYRLDAELIRDMALSVSGLLDHTVGGPSVYPYQPEGYWENLNFPVRSYPTTSGSNQYRRGLYTWWQRSFLHPSLLAFDAPTREECAADRTRSNIPQQALVLMNDPSYVEAARALAIRIHRECKGSTDEKLNYLWQVVLQRTPDEKEFAVVSKVLSERQEAYEGRHEDATRLLSVGHLNNEETYKSGEVSPAELAAWTHVCRIMLNLHESITRP